VEVAVTNVSDVGLVTYSVQFKNPVGDAPSLLLYEHLSSGEIEEINVLETVKGEAPVRGTFTVSYEGYFTNDLAFDSSAAQVKTSLESLPTIGSVAVTRDDVNNGFKWTISFVTDAGNLRLLEAVDRRYEIQRIRSLGGTPTPLDGKIILSFRGDTVVVPFNVSAVDMAASLASLGSIGKVEVSRTTYPNGQYAWLVTFRDLIGDIEPIGVQAIELSGSDADIQVTEIVNGNSDTLTGDSPKLSTLEKVPILNVFSKKS
jgi:hypothetical protein